MLKVLKIPAIFLRKFNPQLQHLEQNGYFEETSEKPVFNRNGFYKDGSNVWIEYEGIVYSGGKKLFLETLDDLNYREHPMQNYKYEILKNFAAVFPELSSAKIKNLLYKENILRTKKKNRIEALKFRLKMKSS